MDWQGDAFIKNLEVELGKRVEKAAIHLTNKIKQNINTSQPYTISSGDGGKYYHGQDPSAPGEFPKKITGTLQRSISYEMSNDKQSAKVGTNLDYGKVLELGGSKVAPRPYLRRTLIEEQNAIDQILTQP